MRLPTLADIAYPSEEVGKGYFLSGWYDEADNEVTSVSGNSDVTVIAKFEDEYSFSKITDSSAYSDGKLSAVYSPKYTGASTDEHTKYFNKIKLYYNDSVAASCSKYLIQFSVYFSPAEDAADTIILDAKIGDLLIGKVSLYWANLKKIVRIPAGTTTLVQSGGSAYKAMEELYIPRSVETIENNYLGIILGGHTRDLPLKKIVFEEGSQLKTIGYEAFEQCAALESVNFEVLENLESIAFSAFSDCTSLATADIESLPKLESIDNYVFTGTAITSVVLPASVTTLGKSVFSRCTTLTSIDFSKATQLEEITRGLCYGCSSLKSVTIPAGIKKFNSGAFAQCTGLETLTFEAPTGWKYNGTGTETAFNDPAENAETFRNKYDNGLEGYYSK